MYLLLCSVNIEAFPLPFSLQSFHDPENKAQQQGCADEDNEIRCEKGHDKGKGIKDLVGHIEEVYAEEDKKNGN